ncbi:hypothetical protein ACH5RR_005139 [Cinchona calisaya]|uniref:Uncharacterized protein n=1 Tax=Cinchona calisaya TaxID=153742 RepID=A0ABD3AKJ2_9GENT
MMMPSISPSSSQTGTVSSSSAVIRVEKATSEFLIAPDWTLNIDICDTINSSQWLAKDVIKAVKKRLQHKNPKVQLLSLTLLETMVKNCGDYVHFQIADRNILQEMVKIVKKKTDMHVRNKILVLLDSWQEAFGGPGGKYPQYYWAYEELRRSGVDFPQRSPDTAPIFTPPMTHPTPRHPQPGYGMPSNSSTRLDEAMAAETGTLSLSHIRSMRDVLDLLADMLQAVNPSDRSAVKDEVIIDLVEQCRSNQKKLMQMLTTTGDEELLGRGLELNDNLQNVLAKHDAIASGLPLPLELTNVDLQLNENHDSILKPTDAISPSATANGNPSPVLPMTRSQIKEEEDEDDDFALLARRHSKASTSATQTTSMQSSEGGTSVNYSSNMRSQESSSSLAMNNALVLADPPAPVRTTKEQDIIDLLSITLSTSASSPQQPGTPPLKQNLGEGTMPSTQDNNSHVSHDYLGSQGQAFNSYIAPWAQPQPQPQFEPQPQPQQLAQNSETLQSRHHHSQYYSQREPQLQLRPQPQPTLAQYSSGYPPPPWAATPGYFSNLNPLSRSSYTYSTAQATSSVPLQGTRTSATNGDLRVAPGGQKPFIPSYRLFEDLNVLGSTDGKSKMTSNSSPPLSGTNGHSMARGAK